MTAHRDHGKAMAVVGTAVALTWGYRGIDMMADGNGVGCRGIAMGCHGNVIATDCRGNAMRMPSHNRGLP